MLHIIYVGQHNHTCVDILLQLCRNGYLVNAQMIRACSQC